MVKFVAYSYVVKTLAEAIIIQKGSRLHREMFEGRLYMCNFNTDERCSRVGRGSVAVGVAKDNEGEMVTQYEKLMAKVQINNAQEPAADMVSLAIQPLPHERILCTCVTSVEAKVIIA